LRQAGTLMRQKAQEMGALTIGASVEVTGIDVEAGRVRRVHTDAGTIESEVVVIACGVWSPRIAEMAGASIPLTPAVHQMIDIGPVPMFANATKEVGYPIVRDMDTNMYERQHGNGFEIGSYAHRAILMDPDDVPSIAAAALSPTMLPFTKDDFDPQLEDALELFPEIVGDESVGVKLAINGLLSLTPDGNPIIGETPEVKNLWSVAAIWIKEAPGIAKTVAEWMTDGRPEIDPDRIGITGHSFGSFFSTIAAAGEPRYRGCAVSGTCLEPGGHAIFEEASPTFKRRFMYMSGCTDEAAFDEFRKTLTWEPYAAQIRAPYLCCTGEFDPLSPLDHTERLFDVLTVPKTLVVYQGAGHGIGGVPSGNLGPTFTTLMADWMAARLAGKMPKSERWLVDATGHVHKTDL